MCDCVYRRPIHNYSEYLNKLIGLLAIRSVVFMHDNII